MLRSDSVIYPIFKMMFVSSFVMQPGSRYSGGFSLCIVRASGPLIVFCSHHELGRRIFRQVMHKSLLIQSHLKTILHNQKFMGCDRLKMSPCVHITYLPVFLRFCGQKGFCSLTHIFDEYEDRNLPAGKLASGFCPRFSGIP